MSKEIGITAKKEEDFSEWYTQVVLKAELADYAPVKGFMVLRPYGLSIWENIKAYFDRRIKTLGHMNAYFPSLIPESFLEKEADHFHGFTPEVFWVTATGEEPLAEKLAVRPTSETIAYATYSKWVRSWRDLPLLLNFWNTVLRAEIKATKPFIRTSEFMWQEGHTVHATREEGESEVFAILHTYKDLCEKVLAIPVLEGKKSEKEKFVGAEYTLTLEALMPDGKALQMATSHNLGQNFSKPFEIKYLGKDNMEHFAWQACWGMSWRLIGALVMTHGDSKGLVLPPRISPIQVVIIPITYGGKDRTAVDDKVKKIARLLRRSGLRVRVDDREEYTPGWKFNEWEMRGVPLRIEVGPRDVKEQKVVLVRRDTLVKTTANDEYVVQKVKEILKDIQTTLFAKATQTLTSQIHETKDYAEFKKILEEEGGLLKSPWCSSRECEEAVKAETGADIRVIPLSQKPPSSPCIYCGKPADVTAYFGRAY